MARRASEPSALHSETGDGQLGDSCRFFFVVPPFLFVLLFFPVVPKKWETKKHTHTHMFSSTSQSPLSESLRAEDGTQSWNLGSFGSPRSPRNPGNPGTPTPQRPPGSAPLSPRKRPSHTLVLPATARPYRDRNDGHDSASKGLEEEEVQKAKSDRLPGVQRWDFRRRGPALSQESTSPASPRGFSFEQKNNLNTRMLLNEMLSVVEVIFVGWRKLERAH